MWTTTVRYALLVFLMIVGCGRVPIAGPDAPAPPNVIIVLVDTLRADHMSLYGYERATTPFIDKFAADAIVFEHARSQANCTFPSVNSLLTSRYPGIFIRQEKGQLGIPEDIPSIAEILSAVGYNTIAVSASPIVRATPNRYNPNGGFDRGFDTFVEGCVWRHGACVNKKVFDQLDLAKSPFFMYVHYMEPHGPYLPPENYSRRFAGDYKGHDFIATGDPNPIAKMLYNDGPELDITDGDIQHLVDLYDDEIRYFDRVFRRLVQNLEERGLLDHTLIVFAADHGEEFMEHFSLPGHRRRSANQFGGAKPGRRSHHPRLSRNRIRWNRSGGCEPSSADRRPRANTDFCLHRLREIPRRR